MTRTRRRLIAALAVASVLAAAGLLVAALGAHGARMRTGPLLVDEARTRPPVTVVRGAEVSDATGTRRALASSVSGALMGPLAPVAVPSPDGSALAYGTWHELRHVDPQLSFSKQGIASGDALAVPVLRVHDASGGDAVLEHGAYSVAWRADGAIGYAKGVEPEFRAGRPYLAQVEVRADRRSPSVRWTTDAARYVVYAWAGARLLFYRIGEGESLALLVADGPGRIRPLADGSAIAVSPDGLRVAVLGADATTVRVLDVATGRELAWLDATTTSPVLRWLGYSGSWTGDSIVAPASSGLAVLRFDGRSLELEQALSLDRAEFPDGVQEPRFADDAATEIVATADVPPMRGDGGKSFFLDCDRVTRTCDRSDGAAGTEWARVVFNPSRPEGRR
jgi:hypothetical protein